MPSWIDKATGGKHTKNTSQFDAPDLPGSVSNSRRGSSADGPNVPGIRRMSIHQALDAIDLVGLDLDVDERRDNEKKTTQSKLKRSRTRDKSKSKGSNTDTIEDEDIELDDDAVVGFTEVDNEGFDGDDDLAFINDGDHRYIDKYIDPLLRLRIQQKAAERKNEFYAHLSRVKQSKQRLLDQNKKLREMLRVYEKKRETADRRLAEQLGAKTAQMGAHQAEIDKRRREAKRRELLEGLEELGDEDGATLVNEFDLTEKNCCQRLRTRFRIWRNRYLLPFQVDLRFIHARFGSAVASYFYFCRFLLIDASFHAVIWIVVFLGQWFDYTGSYWTPTGGLPTWTYYSEFVAGSFLYVSAITVSSLFALGRAIYIWIHEDRVLTEQIMNDSVKTNRKFATAALTLWDFSINDPREADDHVIAMAENLKGMLLEADTQARLNSRTQKELLTLYVKRVIGIILYIGFLFAGWVLIILISIKQQSISDWFQDNAPWIAVLAGFFPAIFTSIINAALPWAITQLTEFESWDAYSTTLKHRLWRMFAAKQLNLLINLVAQWSIARESSILIDITTEYDTSTYACSMDAAAAGLFALVVVEFIFSKIMPFLEYFTLWLLRLCWDDPLTQPRPFLVSLSAITLMTFQSIMWLCVPFFPFGAIVFPFLLAINFKFEKYRLVKLSAKTLGLSSARDTSKTFFQLYNFSLLIALTTYYIFLNSSWDCLVPTDQVEDGIGTYYNGNFTSIGVFSDIPDRIPWTTISETFRDYKITDTAYDILLTPALYMFIIVLIIIQYLFQRNHSLAYESFTDRQKNELLRRLDILERALDHKSRMLEAQTIALNAAERDKENAFENDNGFADWG